MGSESISWERDGKVALLTVASPPFNALDEHVAAGLTEALAEIEATSLSVIVLRSAIPSCFATGADAERISAISKEEFVAMLGAIREAIETLASVSAVSIAAIEGDALGGGLELALACTLRVAAGSSRLGLPDVKLGLLPGGGGTQRLPRLIGRAHALDLLLTGRSVTGREAREMKLVDHVVAQGTAENEALRLAGRIARMSPSALAGITRCVDAAESLPFAEGLAVEADEIVSLFEGS